MRAKFLPVCALFLCLSVVLAGAGAAADGGGIAGTQEEMDGSGTESDPYVITNAEQLQAIQEDPDAHYVLGNDIDASDTENWNGGAGFDPIGSWDSPFSGSLDGQGHTISGLTIDRSSEKAGIFAVTVEGSEIENLHLEDVDVQGDFFGSLVVDGQGTVHNVSATGTATGGSGGGLIGGIDETSVSHIYVDVAVDADETAGGAIGYFTDSELSAAASHGDVTSEGNEVGGLIGEATRNDGVRRSYATGDVSGNEYVGGFVGKMSYDGSMVDAFATGSVDGESKAGGFAGRHRQEVADAYWDRHASGTDTGAGYVTDRADGEIVGLTTDEMTGSDAPNNMDGLDFESSLQITDEYPVFQNEITGMELDLENDQIGEGQTMDATVRLTLRTGDTVTASEVASYDSETAVAEVDAGTLSANSEGVTEVTASVAGYSDTAEVEVLEPPEIELADASLQAEGVVEGSETVVTATYENTGGPGSHEAALAVDGETVTTQSVRVEPDSEKSVEFTWTPESGGEVALADTDLGSLQLVEPGTVTLEDVRVPEEVAQDAVYDAELDLANDADVAVAETVELRVGGDTVASESVVAESGDSTVTLQNTIGEQGAATNVVALRDEELTATTEVVEPIEVSVSSIDAPDSVAANESFDVSVDLENAGGPGGQPVTVSFGGDTVAEETVQFEAGGSGSMTANVSAGAEAGDLQLTVDAGQDSASQNVTVEDDSGSDGSGGGSSGLPGFGVAVALLGILGGALLARRVA